MVKKLGAATAAGKVKAKSAAEATHLSSKLAVGGEASALTASAFCPAHLRLSLFASAVQGLDAHRLRVHDTTTGRLRWDHVLDNGVSLSSLAWGLLPRKDTAGGAKKKRKRLSNGEADEEGRHAVVAAATNQGTVLLLSASEGTVVGALEGAHIGAVRHFAFAEEGRGWSCGADRKLVEWDIARKLSMRMITLPDAEIQRIAYFPPSVLCASHTVYAVDYENPIMATAPKFTANATPIHSLITSSEHNRFLSAADSDRFINIFSVDEEKHLGALVAESDVKSISYCKGLRDEILSAVTTDGVVELFKFPFVPALETGADSPTASRKKKVITRSGEAKIRIIRPGDKENVIVADASLQDEDVVVAWVENGVNVVFQKVRWTNPEDGNLILSGTVEIARTKSVGIGNGSGAVMNGVKDMGKSHVDQSSTVVTSGIDMQDVDMDDAAASPAPSDDENEAADSDAPAAASDDDDDDDDEKDGEAAEPSFADRFQALEVSAKAPPSAVASTTTKSLAPPTAGALTTVLTQALKTDDKALLESCLHTTDSQTILTTIRKLPSPMAVTLLERLAERLARRPGRAGSLGEWVRWTLVAHGGYLVNLPDLVRTLSGLYATLNTRAAALPRLLALQGRLDMLRSQVELRNSLRDAAAGQGVQAEQGVVYIEGQHDDHGDHDDAESSDEEPEEVRLEDASYIKSPLDNDNEDADDDDHDDRGSSAEEGFLDESDDDEEEEEDDDDEEREADEDAFLDIEASEASAEEEEEGSVDWDDEDGEEVASEEEERLVPKKGRARR